MFMTNDFIHDVHKFVYKNVLHPVFSRLGWYAEKEISNSSYICSFELDLDELEEELERIGFVRNPTSFLTYQSVEDYEGRSYTVGSWVLYLDDVVDSYQLHVTLYSAFDDGFVDVYGHFERSWLRHPVKHMRLVDYSEEEGKNMFFEKVDKSRVLDRSEVCRSAEARGW